jgi:DNA-binding GntR family transcriptional regulator
LARDPITRVICSILRKEVDEGQTIIPDEETARFSDRTWAQLDSIGLVDYRRGHPPVVRSFGPQELYEFFHLCSVLENSAIQLACPRMDRDRIIEVRDRLCESIQHNCDQTGDGGIEQINWVHQLILNNCGANRLVREIVRYDAIREAVLELVANQQQEMVTTFKRLVNILDSLLARDANTAAELLSEHFQGAALRRVELIFGKAGRDLIVDPSLITRRSAMGGHESDHWVM